MIFKYKTTTSQGIPQSSTIDAPNIDMAIAALQRRGLVVVSIMPLEDKKPLLSGIRFFNRVKPSDMVLISRQISTLFEAKVSVQETFRLLATEAENPIIRQNLTEMTDEINSGISISESMERHPELFSNFYVSMVRSGEESGKLSEAFTFLADFLDRSYALTSKAKNALVYPIFVVISFIIVMVLMVVFVIPKLGAILADTGQQLPIYTRIILAISNFASNFWYVFVVALAVVGVVLMRYLPTEAGQDAISRLKLGFPYVGDLYRKLYLSRIADNLNTMITSGVSMVRAMEITADVVDNPKFEQILRQTSISIKSGSSVSEVFSQYEEIPKIMIQMIKVGEESGRLGFVLDTMAKFYRREVETAVDTLVGLIEPVMIVVLGLMVGLLLTSVLVPIYNVASAL